MHLFVLSFYLFIFLTILKRFTNEDHLSVHKHKHEMTLKFGPARTDSVIIAGNHIALIALIIILCIANLISKRNIMFIYADQTPTPTRFLKNCEEVGLFNELASSFEQELSKAHEDEHRTKHPVRKKMIIWKWFLVFFHIKTGYDLFSNILCLRSHLYKHHLKLKLRMRVLYRWILLLLIVQILHPACQMTAETQGWGLFFFLRSSTAVHSNKIKY